MMLLTDKEAASIYEAERSHLNAACCGCTGDYAGAVAKAQLKKVVEELEERAEVEHEHCGNSCAHRGVSIWFDIYDWQALKKEIE